MTRSGIHAVTGGWRWRRILLLLAVVLLALAGSRIVSYRNTSRLIGNAHLIRGARIERERLSDLSLALREAQWRTWAFAAQGRDEDRAGADRALTRTLALAEQVDRDLEPALPFLPQRDIETLHSDIDRCGEAIEVALASIGSGSGGADWLRRDAPSLQARIDGLVQRIEIARGAADSYLSGLDAAEAVSERSRWAIFHTISLIQLALFLLLAFVLLRHLVHLERSDEAARQAAEKYRVIADNTHDWEYWLDTEGRVLYCSPACERITGYTPEEFERDAGLLDRIVHPDLRPLFEEHRHDVVRRETTGDLDYKILHKEGGERWINHVCQPVFGADGRFLGNRGSNRDISERKRAEEHLQRSNELLRATIEAAPVAVIGLDLEGRVHAVWNPAAEKMLGWSAHEAMGSFLPSVSPDNEEEFRRFRERILSGRTLNGVEVQRRRRDGTPIDYSIYASPLRDPEGRITGNIAVLVDITEHKRAEAALLRLNRELGAISSCNQVLMRAADERALLEDICRIVCDEAGYRMAWVGYAEGDEAKTIRPVAWAGFESGYIADARLSWADDTDRGRGPAGLAIRGGQLVYSQDFTTDENMAPWRESALRRGYRSGIALPLKDESQRTFGVLLIYSSEPKAINPDEIRLLEELAGDLAFGITTLRGRAEHRRTEEALRESEELYRKLIVASPDAITVTDLSGRITLLSPKALELFGLPSTELSIGRNVFDWVMPSDREMAAENMRHVLATGHDLYREYLLRKSDGTPFHAELSSALILSADGSPKGAVIITRDITDHKRAEEALRESEERLRALLDAAFEGIAITEEGLFVDVSPRLSVIWGYEPRELIGRPVVDFLHADDRDLAARRQAERYELPYEIRLIGKDGRTITAETRARYCMYRGHEVCVTAIHDISIRRRAQKVRQLVYEIGEAAQSSTSLDGLFSSIHGILGRILQVRNFYIALLDETGQGISFPYFVDEREGNPGARPLRRGSTEYVLRLGGPCRLTPEHIRELVASGELEQIGPPAVDWLGVPLKVGGRTIGVMTTQSYQEGVGFTEEDEKVFEFVSSQVAMAVERKRTEESIQRLQRQNELILDAAGEGIFGLDREGRITFANPMAALITGYEVRDLLGRESHALLHHTQPSGLPYLTERCPIYRVLETGEPAIVLEDIFWREDGSPVPVGYVSTPIQANGQVSGAVVTFRDITERLKYEEALRRGKMEWEAAFDAVADLIFLTDAGGRVLRCNRAAAQKLGEAYEDLVGKHVVEALFGARQTAPDTFPCPGRFDPRKTPLDVRLSMLEGWYDVTVYPIRTADRGLEGYVYALRDVTQSLALEQQLRQSQKMEAVGVLAGGVAHDFNNLLQALLFLCAGLRVEPPTMGKLRESLDEMDAHVRRGAALTRQLLLFARPEIGKPGLLDLNEVVTTSMSLLRRLVRENVHLSLDLAGEELPVEVDRGQIEQVLFNLGINAADAMLSGGSLAIRTGREDGAVAWVELQDTGSGIPAELLPRIFDPFFTTKEPGKGTGLGLPVVKRIVEHHRGRVEVRSRPGEGTAFRVCLPLADLGHQGEAAPDAAEQGMPAGHGERILLVEDEDGVRQTLGGMLGFLGYRVTMAKNGEEAEALRPDGPFDVLLTDLMLPGISGSELAERLGARLPALKVIVMSGYFEGEADRTGPEGRTVHMLQKPFDLETLARYLREILPPGRAGSIR